MLSNPAVQASADVAVAPRFPVAGVLVSRTTYADAVDTLIRAARSRVPLVAAATSVHGLTMAAIDPEFGAILNSFDLVTPDGQPVRWALNLLHAAGLHERVYGPTLMRRLCEAAAARRTFRCTSTAAAPKCSMRLVERLSREPARAQHRGLVRSAIPTAERR